MIKKLFHRINSMYNMSFGLFAAFISDYNEYRTSHSNKFTLANDERSILLLSHALEKGMSFTNKRPNWGGVKALTLCKALDSYIAHEGQKNEIFTLAINVLDRYSKDPFASTDKCTTESINKLTHKYNDLIGKKEAGSKEVTEPPYFDENTILSFFSTRRSVRLFSSVAISKGEINKALNIASYTPTACNRQTSKVYAFRDKEKIRKILDLQLGDQGWCTNADTLFVITGVATYFGGVYERHQAYIDGGLFAMNFIYGLHLQHIATCFKMFVRNPKVMKDFRKTCNIQENEIPIVLILAGHYSEESSECPVSSRFTVSCMLDGKDIS